MNKEDINTDQPKPQWFIDLDLYQQNKRSFFVLAQHCLCPKCRERLAGKAISAEELLTIIRDCCSKVSGFITLRMPILESIFRLFLANGNQPLDLEELERQLRERRGEDFCTSVEVLSRLLSNDQWYGLCEVPD